MGHRSTLSADIPRNSMKTSTSCLNVKLLQGSNLKISALDYQLEFSLINSKIIHSPRDNFVLFTIRNRCMQMIDGNVVTAFIPIPICMINL